MNSKQLNQLYDFANWVCTNIGKSANIEINQWFHPNFETEKIQYRVWVNGIINKSSHDLDELVSLIPKFKMMCLTNMEVAA